VSWVTSSGTTQMSPLNFANDVYSASTLRPLWGDRAECGTQERTGDTDLLVTTPGPVSGPCNNDTTMDSYQQSHVVDVCLTYDFMLPARTCTTLLRVITPEGGHYFTPMADILMQVYS